MYTMKLANETKVTFTQYLGTDCSSEGYFGVMLPETFKKNTCRLLNHKCLLAIHLLYVRKKKALGITPN